MKAPSGDGAWPALSLMLGQGAGNSGHNYEIDMQEVDFRRPPSAGRPAVPCQATSGTPSSPASRRAANCLRSRGPGFPDGTFKLPSVRRGASGPSSYRSGDLDDVTRLQLGIFACDNPFLPFLAFSNDGNLRFIAGSLCELRSNHRSVLSFSPTLCSFSRISLSFTLVSCSSRSKSSLRWSSSFSSFLAISSCCFLTCISCAVVCSFRVDDSSTARDAHP